MFFDQSQAYARVPEPGDSSRVLLVQGDVALWEGWPANDAFPTPNWAKTPAEDTQIPLDEQARAAALSNNVKNMKTKLAGAAEELKRPAVVQEPVRKPGAAEELKRPKPTT